MNDVTRLRHTSGHGHPRAAAELLPIVYTELRKLAASKMAREQPGHTLQPTALVHEAWLRLAGNKQQRWDGRDHFFAAAAEAMRRILVDRARKKKCPRHGGGIGHLDIDRLDVAGVEDDQTVLAVSELLDELAQRDPLGAELIKLRFFAGLSNVQAAGVLNIPERTAKRTWAYARAWLFRELSKAH